MTKAKSKKLAKTTTDYSKIIGGSLVVIGLVIIALLVAVLAKTIDNDDDKFEKKVVVTQNEVLDNATVEETKTVVDAKNYITTEEALSVALKNSGFSQQDVWDVDIELEKKFGQMVFEVNFNAGQYEYEYYVNAENGEIVKSFKEID